MRVRLLERLVALLQHSRAALHVFQIGEVDLLVLVDDLALAQVLLQSWHGTRLVLGQLLVDVDLDLLLLGRRLVCEADVLLLLSLA